MSGRDSFDTNIWLYALGEPKRAQRDRSRAHGSVQASAEFDARFATLHQCAFTGEP
jgi:hypothetical protein